MEEEFYARHEECRIQARVNALASVNKLGLPKLVHLSADSFSGLGRKTIREVCKNLERLREVHEDKLPYLIGLSLRESWFSLFDGAGYMALMMAAGFHGDNDYTRKLATPEGYGENEGIAYTLYNHLAEIQESPQQATFRVGTPFDSRISLCDILNGAAMHWFTVAAISYREGNVEGAFDWLFEAQDALSLANGSYMWDEGAKLERESATENSVNTFSEVRTALAKAAAQARHAETRNMKADVFMWLDANMPNFKSMDAAAAAVTKQQPIVFRTARDWVGEWKKLRSASKP